MYLRTANSVFLCLVFGLSVIHASSSIIKSLGRASYVESIGIIEKYCSGPKSMSDFNKVKTAISNNTSISRDRRIELIGKFTQRFYENIPKSSDYSENSGLLNSSKRGITTSRNRTIAPPPQRKNNKRPVHRSSPLHASTALPPHSKIHRNNSRSLSKSTRNMRSSFKRSSARTSPRESRKSHNMEVQTTQDFSEYHKKCKEAYDFITSDIPPENKNFVSLLDSVEESWKEYVKVHGGPSKVADTLLQIIQDASNHALTGDGDKLNSFPTLKEATDAMRVGDDVKPLFPGYPLIDQLYEEMGQTEPTDKAQFTEKVQSIKDNLTEVFFDNASKEEVITQPKVDEEDSDPVATEQVEKEQSGEKESSSDTENNENEPQNNVEQQLSKEERKAYLKELIGEEVFHNTSQSEYASLLIDMMSKNEITSEQFTKAYYW